MVFFVGYPKGTIGGLFYSHRDNKANVNTIRTYVNHVKSICHLELANPLTKRTLLVIR